MKNPSTAASVAVKALKNRGRIALTSTNHVRHYTRWWNPAVENRSTDRVCRIGQDKEVHVYYPISQKNELAKNVIVPCKIFDIEKELLAEMRG